MLALGHLLGPEADKLSLGKSNIGPPDNLEDDWESFSGIFPVPHHHRCAEATHFVSPAAPGVSLSMGDPRLWMLGLSIVLCTVLLAAGSGGAMEEPLQVW